MPTKTRHINPVVLHPTSESDAAERLESVAFGAMIQHPARNDHLGLMIPYESMGVNHSDEPDFHVNTADHTLRVPEIKGDEV